jgi:hypothetical protein
MPQPCSKRAQNLSVTEDAWRTHCPPPPTGVNPQRYLDGFSWDEFKWRRGELRAQFAGLTVLVGGWVRGCGQQQAMPACEAGRWLLQVRLLEAQGVCLLMPAGWS